MHFIHITTKSEIKSNMVEGRSGSFILILVVFDLSVSLCLSWVVPGHRSSFPTSQSPLQILLSFEIALARDPCPVVSYMLIR